MVNSRNKGAAFEREIAKALELELGISFRRDLEQYRSSDLGDLIADDPAFPFIVECKRYAVGTGCQADWWRQAVRAAEAANKLPAVVYKFDRRDVRVVVNFTALYRAFGGRCTSDHQAELTLEAFCYIAREIMSSV